MSDLYSKNLQRLYKNRIDIKKIKETIKNYDNNELAEYKAAAEGLLIAISDNDNNKEDKTRFYENILITIHQQQKPRPASPAPSHRSHRVQGPLITPSPPPTTRNNYRDARTPPRLTLRRGSPRRGSPPRSRSPVRRHRSASPPSPPSPPRRSRTARSPAQARSAVRLDFASPSPSGGSKKSRKSKSKKSKKSRKNRK
jgi:hypothetical protein